MACLVVIFSCGGYGKLDHVMAIAERGGTAQPQVRKGNGEENNTVDLTG